MDMKAAAGSVYWQRSSDAEKDRADALHPVDRSPCAPAAPAARDRHPLAARSSVMGIVRFALRFPYTYYVVAALIVFLGGIAAHSMRTDIFP